MTRTTAYPPTAEQQAAIDFALTGRTFKIEAGAGTGKTSTFEFLAQALPAKRIQYVAFNRPIVEEARRKFPRNVTCSTAHSLAWRTVGSPFESRMNQGKRMRSTDIAAVLGIDSMRVTDYEGEEKLLSASFLAGITLGAVLKFCQTADLEPAAHHVPRVTGLDGPRREQGLANRRVAQALMPAVRRAWADLQHPEGGLPFTKSTAMSVFLKLWHLSRPIIAADVILFDEAQDANPVMQAVVSLQADPDFRASRGLRPAQLVWVGDSQQAIYGFTGAVNALANIPATDATYLTQSFRFGPAVAAVANHVLGLIPDAVLRITGNDGRNSVVGPVLDPDAILTRTNATAVSLVLNELAAGRRPHLIGGGGEIIAFAKAARDLQSGLRTDHPDLAFADSWAEVQDYVERDEQGDDLRLLVNLIDEFGAATIIEALENQPKEDDADLIVCTAHKSKGREWDSVKIAGDFPEDRLAAGGDQATDELRLLYVAVTRARLELDVEEILFLRDLRIPDATNVTPVTMVVAAADRDRTAVAKSDHVGQVGDRIERTLLCQDAKGLTTKYGFTYLTRFVDADGNVFKAFINYPLEAGARYVVTAQVKAHTEFRGVKETEIRRVDALEAAEPVASAGAVVA